MLGYPHGVSTDEFIKVVVPPLISNHIGGSFLDLLYDQDDLCFTPDVAGVPHIHQRANIKAVEFPLLLSLQQGRVPVVPVIFDLLYGAVLHHLSNEIINFKVSYQRLVTKLATFGAIEVTDKAGLLVDQVVLQAVLAVTMAIHGGDTPLHEFQAQGANEFKIGILILFLLLHRLQILLHDEVSHHELPLLGNPVNGALGKCLGQFVLAQIHLLKLVHTQIELLEYGLDLFLFLISLPIATPILRIDHLKLLIL